MEIIQIIHVFIHLVTCRAPPPDEWLCLVQKRLRESQSEVGLGLSVALVPLISPLTIYGGIYKII